jgi:bacterial/archaeal transporter family-2 protein
MMSITLALVFLFILVSGGLRSIEMGCQNTQQRYLKNSWLCAVSFFYAVALTGFLVFLGLFAVLADQPKWPTLSDVSRTPWCAPFGGLVGGVAVVGMIAAAHYIGAATPRTTSDAHPDTYLPAACRNRPYAPVSQSNSDIV